MRTVALISAAALPLASAALPAQALLDASARLAPQYVSYRLGTPVSKRIAQLALPVMVAMPLGDRFSLDIATAYASSEATSGAQRGAISGLTDTQIRGSYTFGRDALVLTAGLNLPTGRSTVRDEQIEAAGQIGSDFLIFPISNMGTGFAATGGVAYARAVASWNLGVGASVRHSAGYEPFEVAGARSQFQPGDEYRLRLGGDRDAFGGRMALGATYSTFGSDAAGSFTYSTGDRYVIQGAYSRRLAGAEVVLSAWNLLRGSGERAVTADSAVTTPWENIANVALSAGFELGAVRLEPSIEARSWSRERDDGTGFGKGNAGRLALLGLRARIDVFGLGVMPSVGLQTGHLNTTAGRVSVDGWRGGLTIRAGR